MTAEKLIYLVKRNPVLYDKTSSHYRDNNARNQVWEEIAEQMNMSVADVKAKWANLRNCLSNVLRRRIMKGDPSASPYNKWRLEKQMGFLMPHLEQRPPKSSDGDNSLNDIHNFDFKLYEEPDSSPSSPPISPAPSTPSSPTRTSNINESNLLGEMIEIIKSSQDKLKRSLTDLDENDYFFLSMSKQIKTLPKTDQAEIKFQLHKLVYEKEMKMLNNSETNQNEVAKKVFKPIVLKRLVTTNQGEKKII